MELLEILKYTIPSLILLVTCYLIIKKFLDADNKKRLLEIQLASKDIINPVKMQAYERIILFLERITPNSLIMRLHQQGFDAQLFHKHLIQTIRDEYEHNLSQQLYISSTGWELVKNAKEEIIKIINTAANKINKNENNSATELSEEIIKITLQLEKMPTYIAIEYLKAEFKKIF